MDQKTFVDKVQAKKAAIAAKPETIKQLSTATPEEAKKIESEVLKKAKSAVKQEERDEALKLVLDTIGAVASDDAALMAAVAILKRETRHAMPGIGAPRAKSDITLQMFPNGKVGDTFTGDQLYALAKLGRGDGRRIIQNAVKGAKTPADRKWIAFDLDSDTYTLAGIGATPPTGWTGYIPVTMATEKAATTPTGADKQVSEKLF